MKTKRKLLLILCAGSFLLFSCNNSAFKNTKIETEIDSVSYSMGILVSQGVTGEGVEELNAESIAEAVDATFNNEEYRIPEEEAAIVLNKYFDKLRQKLQSQNPMDTLQQDNLVDEADVKTTKGEIDTCSYGLGISLSTYYQALGLEEMNSSALGKGIEDFFNNGDILIDEQDANMAVMNYFNKLRALMAEKNLKEGLNFLEKNKSEEGVVTLESGLQYVIMQEGSGKKPLETDMVSVHYHGTIIDGTVFDSSVERGTPAQFPVNGVITGWIEVLQLMPVGSKWKVFIPTELAYGENPRPGVIQPNMMLIFEIELLSIEN